LARHQQLKAAEQYVLTALELITRDPNPHIEAAICDSAGFICARLGRYSEAEAFAGKAVSLFEHNDNKAELLPALLHLSEMHEQCGHQKAARETARRALDLAAAVNLDPVREAAQNRLLTLQSSNSKVSTKPFFFHGLIYTSQEMKSVVARLRILAMTSETVLLLGETGTGKELIARAIHQESKRCNGPFIPFNCSAISRELIESRLFGYRRGAFTGAESEQIGIVRAAAGGTLFLDEIGDLSLAAQGVLLRFLQSGEIQPLGQNKPIKIDVRVIAATNRNLNEDLESGRFREDLYFRLSVCTLRAPTLRSRPQDVPILANHFASVYSEEYNLPAPAFTVDELSGLAALRWNGNVRELESYVKRRVMFGTDAIETSDGLFNQQDRPWRALTPTEKRGRLNEGLLANKGNITSTAKRLGISRRTIQRIKKADDSGH
jgi:two-component system NtrC family response regulator